MTDRVKAINANQRGSTESGENATRISNPNIKRITMLSLFPFLFFLPLFKSQVNGNNWIYL